MKKTMLVCFLVMVMVLSGCGGAGKQTNGEPEPTATPTFVTLDGCLNADLFDSIAPDATNALNKLSF